MADAMVTARMPIEKKEAAYRVFEKLGTNASQVINSVFDYVIENEAIPCAEEQSHVHTPEEIAEAIAWVDSLPSIPVSKRFTAMTDDEIRQERLVSRGLATWEDFA